ncbi:MAG TPA: hypothetical protein VFT72_02055 [Opitutaceae bacterium]|nr:hypothetical protein [Opitutaceae bacterium]
MKKQFLLVWAFALAALISTSLSAAPSDAENLAVFERKATLAKQLGATHVPITDALPPALWEFQPAGDPYPAWYIQRPDFLKLYAPPELRPFVDAAYVKRVTGILEERCRILRKLGLKAHWGSNLPQVLPEAFFTAHPELRGPRVDQPNRSRTARFSACVDQPETQRLYAEAMKTLLERCPEIETFAFLTQDSGSGFCWAPSLYPGINGPEHCHDRPMSERVSSFLIALKNAAHEAGHEIEISVRPITPRQWMLPTFSPEELEAIWHRLPRGIAVQGREGPDGRKYVGIGSSDAYAHGAFYPVTGIIVPAMRHVKSEARPTGDTRRLISLRPEEAQIKFNARIQQIAQENQANSQLAYLTALRGVAVEEVGEKQADTLMEVWSLIDEAEHNLTPLEFGDMLQFGHVLNRWINRPMVPFPAELKPEEKTYYRPFLFQAKGEEQAENLIDIQAMRMYEGYGAHLLFQRVIETSVPDLRQAIARVQRIHDSMTDAGQKARWDLLARRLEAVICLLQSADHMVAYQAQLDRVRQLDRKPEPNPVLGVQSSWDRTDLIRTARSEIDTTTRLLEILRASDQPILDLASDASEETIMRLGPDLAAQLKKKIDIMNAHWTDYDRLFSVPNP